MEMKYVLTLIVAAMLAGCNSENIPVPEKPGTEDTGTSDKDDGENDEAAEEVTNPLGLKANLNSMQESRANVITAWQTGHNMGLYTDGHNLSYTYNGNEWVAKTPYQVDKQQEVFAYYPYVNDIPDNMTVPVNLTRQDDILYGKTTVSADFPQAQVTMHHTMSLVRVKILRDEYRGTGRIDNVTFNGVPKTAQFNIADGTVYGSPETTGIKVGGAYMLDDLNPTVNELITPSNYATGYSISFELDGKTLTYYFPSGHSWDDGMIYTYTVKIKGEYNSEVNIDDVPIDVEYWSQFGKTDEIVWKYPDNNGKPGFRDKEDRFTIASNYTFFGYDTYQNEGKVFGMYYYFWGSQGFEGKMRFVFMQGDRIVEKFQPVDFKMYSSWGGKAIQCYVTSNPGTYQLVPLFQRKGESTWFKAIDYDNSSDEQWMYEVLPPAPDNLPSLRQLYLEKEEQNIEGLAYRIPYNKDFGVVYTLSNKGKKALKGKIRATWEREFKLKSNSYFPDTKKQNTTNDNEWNDVIGEINVDIPAGVRFWKGLMNCKVTKWYDMPMSSNGVQYAGAVMHLYWQAEGSNEWTLLRLDADYLFNNGYQGTTSIWNETRNYIGVSLEEWC